MEDDPTGVRELVEGLRVRSLALEGALLALCKVVAQREPDLVGQIAVHMVELDEPTSVAEAMRDFRVRLRDVLEHR